MSISTEMINLGTALEDAALRLETYIDDCKWYAWQQMWSDTSCGFGGVAGQSLTTATVIVVVGILKASVYIDARFAYECDVATAHEYINVRQVPSHVELDEQEKD